MAIHLFLGLIRPFPVHVFEDMKGAKLKIFFGARNLNGDQRLICLKTKNFFRQLQIHRQVEFSQGVDWKMVAFNSLKKRNLGFKVSFESTFSGGNHCLNTIQHLKRLLSLSTKLCYEAFVNKVDFKGRVMIYLVKFFGSPGIEVDVPKQSKTECKLPSWLHKLCITSVKPNSS